MLRPSLVLFLTLYLGSQKGSHADETPEIHEDWMMNEQTLEIIGKDLLGDIPVSTIMYGDKKNFTDDEQAKKKDFLEQLKESQAEAKRLKSLNILWDQNVNEYKKDNRDMKCESCQFMILDLDYGFQAYRRELAKQEQETGQKMEEKMMWDLLLVRIKNQITHMCQDPRMLLHWNKINLFESYEQQVFCAQFVYHNRDFLVTLMLKKFQPERKVREMLCAKACNPKNMEESNKSGQKITHGLWKRLIDYPNSPARLATPWMRREIQGNLFGAEWTLHPKVEKSNSGWYFRTLSEGSPTHSNKMGAHIWYHFWSKYMFEEKSGQLDANTYHGKPIHGQIGVGHFNGLIDALRIMSPGDNLLIYFPSEHTWGVEDRVPEFEVANTHILCQVHLLAVGEQEPPEEVMNAHYEMHPDHKLDHTWKSPYHKQKKEKDSKTEAKNKEKKATAVKKPKHTEL